MRIYISGPITGTDDYMKRFCDADRILSDKGYEVINPAAIARLLPDFEPNEYMKIDLKLLELCDAIYLLDGWQHSNGAKKELYRALCDGKKVIVQGKENDLLMDQG